MGQELSAVQVEILDLMQRAQDGLLSDHDVVRLNELIESSEEACRTLLLSANLDAEIAHRVRMEAAGVTPPRESLSGGTAEIGLAALLSSLRNVSIQSVWIAAIAASLLGVVAAITWLKPYAEQSQVASGRLDEVSDEGWFGVVAVPTAIRRPQPVATLVSSVNATFLGRHLVDGHSLSDGAELILLEGEAQVGMGCGANLILKGRSHLRFIAKNRVELLKGVLAADVAKWGSGFTVDTQSMRVTDLGTRFAVDASSAGVEAHVIEGSVRVQPLSVSLDGRRSMLLNEGEAIRVAAHGDRAQKVTLAKDRFVSMAPKSDPYKPIPIPGTGIGLAEGDEDSNWRITAGKTGGLYKGPQYAVVCAVERGYAANEPDRSQWISVAGEHSPGVTPLASFTYETNFDLSGYDTSSVIIVAQILADNGVKEIRLNGNPIEFAAWNDTAPLQSFARDHFHLVELKGPFLPRANRLEFDVWNGEYYQRQIADRPNPMALRVEFQAFGRLHVQAIASEACGPLRFASVGSSSRDIAWPLEAHSTWFWKLPGTVL